MKQNKKQEHDEISFWESTSDLLAALLLILLLIIVLLFLYLRMIPENQEVDPEWGDTYEEQETEYKEEENHFEQIQRQTDLSDHTAGHTQNDTNDNHNEDEEEESEEREEWEEEEDEFYKSAVLLKVVDAETGAEIPQNGIKFRLFRSNNTLQVLYDYYPEKIAIKEFETNKKGQFYLPEKIYEGYYYFKDMTTISGYMLAPNAEFEINEYHDWSDPVVVTVALSPYKNLIAIHVKDADSNVNVTGSTFDIVAMEDILTADGTIRYEAGEIAGTLICDRNGYAVSEELYLGKYELIQKKVAEYYAAMPEPLEIDLEELSQNLKPDDLQTGKFASGTPTQEILAEKTRILFRLTDEAENNTGLSDVNISVTCDGDKSYNQTLTTDAQGEIQIENLKKNTTYHFKQLNATGNYRIIQNDYKVKVDAGGRIDGEALYVQEAVNRLIRVTISVRDAIMQKELGDVSLSLYNEKDKLIKTWSTTFGGDQFDNLDIGRYYLIIDGKEDEKHEFEVIDTADMQYIDIVTYTKQSNLMLAVIALGGIVVLGIVLFIVFRVRKNRKKSETES